MTNLPLRFALLVVLAAAPTASGADAQRLVEEQLRYLGHLQAAEQHLEASDPDAALAELTAALSCNVPDSHVPQLQLNTQGAVAHYLRACAFAMKHEQATALDHLKAAAKNGFRNTRLVTTDPRLAEVRTQDAFAEVLTLFPEEQPTDEYAGKMVADRQFGIAMQMHRKGNFPKLGEQAPDFELNLLGEETQTLRLSEYRGKTPVVLMFGSFT